MSGVLENDFVLMIHATPILVDHETGYVEKLISLVFHVYKERANWRSYTLYASI
jgi:hypothetical protein